MKATSPSTATSRSAPGSLLFVPALRPHRFTPFTDDFSTWVVFYGPDGGEHP